MKPATALLPLLLLVGCSVPTGGGQKVVEEYEDGQKKSEGYELEDGTMVGRWNTWHENGEKNAEGEFKNGEKEGLWTVWHENGQK